MFPALVSAFFQTVKVHLDNTKTRAALEKMQSENTKLVVSMYGTFPFIYFIGPNDSRDTLLLLIQLACCSMDYALIYHKDSNRIFAAVSEHSFSSGFDRAPLKIYNFKKSEIPRVGYRTFFGIAHYKRRASLQRISFCYLKTELSGAQLEEALQLLREYRWVARREALLVAARIFDGDYFHVFKWIAVFI